MRLGCVLLGCLASMAAANGTRPMPLETQLLRADLVLVGQLGSHTTCMVAGGRYPCAEIRSDVVLKGARQASGTRRYLLLFSGVMELPVQNIRIPGGALFFLNRVAVETSDGAEGDRELFRPVRGRRSVLRVDNNETAP